MRTENEPAPLEAANEPKPEFLINCEDAANWYLRRLANIEAEKQRVTRQAAQIVAQLDADADALRYLYEGQLQAWTRAELAKRGNRRKSLALLQGTASFRTVPAGVSISDASAALAYAISCVHNAVLSRPTLDAGKYREAAEKALENEKILPGIETTPERESFTVKFGKSQ